MCILRAVPDLPIRAVLISASDDVLDLEQSAVAVSQREMPELAVMARHFAQQAGGTATMLWARTQRVAAAAKHGVDTPRLQARLESELQRLAELRRAIGEARAHMAELALQPDAGMDLASATLAFRALGEVTEELQRDSDGRMPGTLDSSVEETNSDGINSIEDKPHSTTEYPRPS
jgi:hypothetical protein